MLLCLFTSLNGVGVMFVVLSFIFRMLFLRLDTRYKMIYVLETCPRQMLNIVKLLSF